MNRLVSSASIDTAKIFNAQENGRRAQDSAAGIDAWFSQKLSDSGLDPIDQFLSCGTEIGKAIRRIMWAVRLNTAP